MRKGVKVVHTIAENACSELRVTQTHTYDTEGRLCSYIIYDESGGLEKEYCYEYYDLAKYKNVTRKVITIDEHGSFLSGSTFDLSGNLTNRNEAGQEFYYEYEHDDKGRVKIRTEYDSEDSPQRRIVFSYDSRGNKTEERHEERFFPNDEWVELVKSEPNSEYDENKVEFGHEASVTFKYDETNRLSEKSYGTISIRYNKEDRSYVERTTTRYAEDEWGVVYRRYDNQGDLVKTWEGFDWDNEPDLTDCTYSYVFDDEGNWIKRTVTVSEKVVGITSRVILYFPDKYTKLIRAVEVEPRRAVAPTDSEK